MEVGVFTVFCNINSQNLKLEEIYLCVFWFKSKLSLLRLRICYRIGCKTEGSRNTMPVLRTGRLTISKMHATLEYYQSTIIGCNRIVHGAKSSV
jgi:hypothetical protein